MEDSIDIAGFSGNALRELRDSLRAPAPDVSVYLDLDSVAKELHQLRGQTIERFDKLIDVLANPTATTGDELLRRGILAWKNRWWDDAERDLRESIASYPYRAGPYLFLALVQLENAATVEATENLRLAVKYGPGGDQSVAAAAALMGDMTLAAAGGVSDAIALLRQASELLPPCPSIAARLYIRTKDREFLARAVRGYVTTGHIPEGAAEREEVFHDARRTLNEISRERSLVESWLNTLNSRFTPLFEGAAPTNELGWRRGEWPTVSLIRDDPLSECIELSDVMWSLRNQLDDIQDFLGRCAAKLEEHISRLETSLARPRRDKLMKQYGGFFEKRARAADQDASDLESLANYEDELEVVTDLIAFPVQGHLEAIVQKLPNIHLNDAILPITLEANQRDPV